MTKYNIFGKDIPSFAEMYDSLSEKPLYLNESSWKKGQWVVQKHPDFNIYMLLVDQLKNGGWSAITIDDEVGGRNMAAKQSIKNAYPTPEPIDVKNVPPKLKAKVDKKISQLGIDSLSEKPLKVKTNKGEVSLNGNDTIEYEAKPGVVRVGMADSVISKGVKFKKGGTWYVAEESALDRYKASKAKGDKASYECMECGKKFKSSKSYDVKCPKCKSTDVEPA